MARIRTAQTWLMLVSWGFLLLLGNTDPGQNPVFPNQWTPISRPMISGGVIHQMVLDTNDRQHLIILQDQIDSGQTLAESWDAGAHWQNLATFQQFAFQSLIMDPGNTKTFYAGSDHGLFRSVNGGKAWETIAATGPLIAVPAPGMIYSIEQLAPTADCPSGAANLIRSQDLGETWSSLALPCNYYSEIISPAINPQVIYIRGSDSNLGSQWLRESNDGGNTWTTNALTGPLFQMGFFPIEVDPHNSEKLYSSSGTGVIISTDSGQSWLSTLTAPVTGPFQFSFKNNGIYAVQESTLVGTIGDLYVSTNGGISWTNLFSHFPANPLSLIVSPEDNGPIYVGLDGFGILTSADSGDTWQSSNIGLNSTTRASQIRLSSVKPSIAYEIIDWPRPALFSSQDGGTTWSLPLVEGQLDDMVTNPQDAAQIWAVGPEGILESQDGGAHWILGSSLSGTSLAISPTAPDRPCVSHTDQSQGYLVCRAIAQNGTVSW